MWTLPAHGKGALPAGHFGLDEDPPRHPRSNIALTQQVATIRQHPAELTLIFCLMQWVSFHTGQKTNRLS